MNKQVKQKVVDTGIKSGIAAGGLLLIPVALFGFGLACVACLWMMGKWIEWIFG